VVPLADFTLVLLIILMVLSPMISQSMIRVATPQVQAGGTGDPAENAKEKIPLLVSISMKQGYVEQRPFEDAGSAFGNLKEKLMEDRGRPVIVSADDGVLRGPSGRGGGRRQTVGRTEVSLVKSAVPERKK
jgi:biopolymer transport protein ExbD